MFKITNINYILESEYMNMEFNKSLIVPNCFLYFQEEPRHLCYRHLNIYTTIDRDHLVSFISVDLLTVWITFVSPYSLGFYNSLSHLSSYFRKQRQQRKQDIKDIPNYAKYFQNSANSYLKPYLSKN